MSCREIPLRAIISTAIAKEPSVSNTNLDFSLVAMRPRRKQPAPISPAMFGFIKTKHASERQYEICTDLRSGFLTYNTLDKKNSVAAMAVPSLYHQKQRGNT